MRNRLSMKLCQKIFSENIRWNQTITITLWLNNSDNSDEKYMKIKFNADDNLPLRKTLEFYNMVIVVRSVFLEDNKYYSQVFLGECLYKLQSLEYERIDVSVKVLFVIIVIFSR